MKKILILTLSIACLAVAAPAQKPTVTADFYLYGTKTPTVTAPMPEYPADALDKGFNGVVLMAITVDRNGSVTAAKATRGPASTCEGVTNPTILPFRKAATHPALPS